MSFGGNIICEKTKSLGCTLACPIGNTFLIMFNWGVKKQEEQSKLN